MKTSIVCLIHISCLLRVSRSYEIPKIAIIGSGIGGSSCGHFLREIMQKNVEIDVYEANEIGGRLATRYFKGAAYEVGGCVIHSRNKYMNDFREYLKLEERKDDSESSVGIYDEDGIEFISSDWKFLTFAKMLIRYGYSLFKLDTFVEKMLDEFDRIYEIQEQGKAFNSAEELLGEASSNFLTYLNITSEEGFSSIADINNVTIKDLVRGSLRVNYGQSTNVHLFVGAVSVAGMTGSLWSVEGGNKQIPELLIKNSDVNFINNKVTTVKLNDDKSFTVNSVNLKDGSKLTKIYDAVILAHPITSDCKNPIEFLNFPQPIEVEGKYHRTISTILSGNLNVSYFGIKEKKVPDLVINNDLTKVINSVGKISPVDSSKSNANNVWKVFSQRPLRDEELDKLFYQRSSCTVVDWLAYPEYSDLGLSGIFILYPRLYYINAIEWAASAMEMSVIGAKNVALLVSKELSDFKSGSKRARNEL